MQKNASFNRSLLALAFSLASVVGVTSIFTAASAAEVAGIANYAGDSAITTNSFATSSEPLQTLFEKGELILSLQESQANALGSNTFTKEQLAQQSIFFEYLQKQIGETPALGYFVVERYQTMPNCALIMSVPVAVTAHKMITQYGNAPLAVQYSLCEDGTFPPDNPEIKAIKAKQRTTGAGTQTPQEISKLLHQQQDKAAKQLQRKVR